MALLRILSLRYFAGNNSGKSAPSTEREVRMKVPLLLRFLSPGRSLVQEPPSARPRRLLPKHPSASKSGVWRQQCWLSWSWRRRVFQAAWRALVARPGAQLARGAAVLCCVRLPLLSVGPGAPLLAEPRVPHSKRHNRIPQRGVTCRQTDGRRNGLAMHQQLVRACDQEEGVEVTCSSSAGQAVSLPTRCHYIQSSGSSLRLGPPLTQTLGQRQIQ